jgi:hypothetical protein
VAALEKRFATLIHWEFPRLCRGGSRSLTFPGVCPGYPLQVVGFIKRKSTIHLERLYGENRRNFVGQSFWALGYSVSPVGCDETVIRTYIRNQEQEEQEEQRLEQMNLWR